jgi:hypothetical protein
MSYLDIRQTAINARPPQMFAKRLRRFGNAATRPPMHRKRWK